MLAKIDIRGELAEVPKEVQFTRRDGTAGSLVELIVDTGTEEAALTAFDGRIMEYIRALSVGDYVEVEAAVECRRGKEIPGKPLRRFTPLKCLHIVKKNGANDTDASSQRHGMHPPPTRSMLPDPLMCDPDDIPF